MNINASKEHKKDTSRIIRSNNKLLDSSREANRNKYAHTIQCNIPPTLHGKRQGSICHNEQVAYRPLIIW